MKQVPLFNAKTDSPTNSKPNSSQSGRGGLSNPEPGIVYFIGGDRGAVKIGFTSNLPARLRRLQMSSPIKLRILAAYEGSREDELIEHRLRRRDRLHGEWFKRTAGTASIIRWWRQRRPHLCR